MFSGNGGFREYYVSEALRFMNGNSGEAEEAISQMVFAEQRRMAMCAAATDVEILELMPCDPQEWQKQSSFTYIWGYKDVMRDDESRRESFCDRCISRIVHDFPDLAPVLEHVPELQRYFGRQRPGRRTPHDPPELSYRDRFPCGGYGLLP